MSGSWTPARPERNRAAWAEPVASPIDDRPEEAPRFEGPSRTRRPSWFRSLGPGGRLAAGIAALAAAALVITSVGSSVTPDYGDLDPLGGAVSVDLRTSPAAAGWSTDLAREMFPGVPARCAQVAVSSTTDNRVLLNGRLFGAGIDSSCSTDSFTRVRSKIALFDTSTGRVLWTRDLSKDFSGDISVNSTSVLPALGRVTMMVTAGGRNNVATLDLATGRRLSSLDLADASSGVSTYAIPSGGLMLFGASTSREGSTAWTLVDARDLKRALWTAVLPDADQPVVTDGAVFVQIRGRSMRIDGVTGAVTRFQDGRVPLDAVQTSGHLLFVTRSLLSGTVISAFRDDGTRVWTRSGSGGLTGVTRDCVITSLDGTLATSCLDIDTGRVRWTSDVGSGLFGQSIPGQTSDDVFVYQSRGEGSAISLLDGQSGRKRFELVLPALSQPVLASRTVVYVEQYTASGTVTSVTAYDSQTGAALWTKVARLDGDTEIWGGHLVRMRPNGRVDELTTLPGPVLRG